MSKHKYPQYRMSQWGDMNPALEQVQIVYGIEAKPHAGSQWMPCCAGPKPLLFATREEAHAEIVSLRRGSTQEPSHDD